MPNTTVLTQTISSDHKVITITDATVFTNPTRATCGVFMNGYKVNFQGGETKLDVTPNNTDPNLTSSWTLQLLLDGHYRYKYISVPDYNISTTYDIYDAAFDPVSGKVYVSKVSGNVGNSLLDTSYWGEVSDPPSLLDYLGTVQEPSNCDVLLYERVVGVLTKDKRDDHAVEASLEVCLDCERERDVDKFTILDLFAEALIEADSAGEFNKGERIARRAESV